MADKWIWLPKIIYPENQKTKFDALSGGTFDTYAVAEFKRTYSFEKRIENVRLRFSGDTSFQLFCNGEIIATGPASVGGDFLCNGMAREWYYATETEYAPKSNKLEFFARVKMMPVQMCEYSKGRGGFMLTAEAVFEDGSIENITTDESWLVRKNGAYTKPVTFDGTVTPDPYVNAEVTEDIWHAEKAPIPPRTEKEITAGVITLAPGEQREEVLALDMIYAGFLHAKAETDGYVEAELFFLESDEEKGSTESLKLTRNSEYRGFHMHSAGNIRVNLKNLSDTASTVKIGFITTCYPVTADASTVTGDEAINRVLNVCKHTLKYCRQTHHLDSPRHCEPLACTGDYYIESLMTAFSFGDQRLSEFDVIRTAEVLRHNDGRMFHTTYSLIWVRMLYDTYMLGGNKRMLEKCRDALELLLNRFETYVGENGLIENPPDYMFVDWIYIDEISMHHPPKCLGQSALNMFYHMALEYAEKIYDTLCDPDKAKGCKTKRLSLKKAINTYLFDKEKGVYFEGLNTPTAKEQIYNWLPENKEKRYYLKHSNILAAYTSVCDTETARKLIDKIMTDEIEGDVQPYFMHYLFEAVYTHGLREKYTLQLVEKWKKPTEDCPKGLVEGFVAPEPTYRFDHSHAWGGTPLWSLPKALLGLSVDKPGLEEITLSPSLLGLEKARVELPTPKGMLVCEMQKGKTTKVSAPAGVKVKTVE